MDAFKGFALQSDEEIFAAKPERLGCILCYGVNCCAVLQFRGTDAVKRPRFSSFRMNVQHYCVFPVASTEPEISISALKYHVYREWILP